MVFLFFFVSNATSRDSNANSTAHKMGNSEENAQRSEQSRYLRSTDQEACRIVPLSQALRSPSQNFRTMRHIPEALKSEEGEGEISRRCPKNGNPMAFLLCVWGASLAEFAFVTEHPKSIASTMKKQHLFMSFGRQS